MEYRLITNSGYKSLGSRGFTFDQPNQVAQDPYLQGDKSRDSTVCWEKLKYLVNIFNDIIRCSLEEKLWQA